ncbi:sce7725 family protein [Cupriavidus sp. JZ107]
MYYPYFFGRRSELLALRDVARPLATAELVAPVIEPVREDPASLILTFRDHLQPAGQIAYLIENPILGQFESNRNIARDWFDEVSQLFASPVVRPTFLASPKSTLEEFREFVLRYRGRSIGIVLRNSAISPVDLAAVSSAFGGDRRFFLTGGSPMASTLRALGVGNCVKIEDRFETQPRNAAYTGVEPFSDAHLSFSDAGFAGFGDYTVLPGVYSEGGGPPGAIAIHLTFVDRASHEIFVEHFVSDTIEAAIRDNDLKFREAIAKIPRAIARSANSFGPTEGVNRYVAAARGGTLPTLAGNKRWSIAHHLELVSGVMSGRFA